MTKPEKQDGTMELDVGQIDLLDLPLPPRSKPELETTNGEEPRGSKGPPPLPPSLPPTITTSEEPAVPSLVLPESKPRITPSPPVSARKLVGPSPAEEKSPVMRFMVGMGAATIVCVLAYVGFRTLHKTPAAQAPAPSASAVPTPTHAFTMAPIEFTAPSSSDEQAPSARASASPPPSASAAPAATTTATHAPAATTSRATTPASTTTTGAKPPRTDELIKVEN